MICPKCDEGKIGKILFKKGEQIGFLCDFCATVWFEGETIHATTGHVMQSLSKNNEMEYTIVDIDEKDADAKSVMYPKIK